MKIIMNFRIKTSIPLMLLTVLDLLMRQQYIAEAAINHSNTYNNNNNNNHHNLTANLNDSDVNISNNDGFIHRISNDNIKYNSIDSDINIRNRFSKNDDDDDDDASIAISKSQNNQNTQQTNSEVNNNNNNPNFIITDYLSDGEVERRISYNGVTAKETRISTNEKSLSLWQLSHDDTFIQMIYSLDNELLDCEYLKGRNFAEQFVEKFYNEIDQAERLHKFTAFAFSLPKLRHHPHRDATKIDWAMDSDDEMFGMRNISYQPLATMHDVPEDLAVILNYEQLKVQCDDHHHQMMRIVNDSESDDHTSRLNASDHLNRRKRALSDWLIAPNTKWCGRGQTADKYSQLGGASKADKCCRRHDHCKFNIYAMTTKWRLFNYRPFTISHCSCDMRHRRDLSNLLRVPGTKWCGKGYSAKKYAELGGRSKADRCCRQHDKSCPFWIMGFETKYGFFNWRLNTLMHCKCDDRFRTCLKMADSADATMVGKLFFNIVQTKCFVLKPERFCKKHSWWGGCEKEGVRKRAHLRTNKKF